MTVSDLKKILDELPDDMEVIYDRRSDYCEMKIDEITVVEAVNSNHGWLMRSHPTMSAENVANAKKYLHFPGN